RREIARLRARGGRLEPGEALRAASPRRGGAQPETPSARARRRRRVGLRLDDRPRVSRGPLSGAAALPARPDRARALPPARGGCRRAVVPGDLGPDRGRLLRGRQRQGRSGARRRSARRARAALRRARQRARWPRVPVRRVQRRRHRHVHHGERRRDARRAARRRARERPRLARAHARAARGAPRGGGDGRLRREGIGGGGGDLTILRPVTPNPGRRIAIGMALLVALSGCGAQLATPAGEASAGAEAAAEVEKAIGLVEAPALASYLDEIGQRLVTSSPDVRRDIEYQFLIVDMPEPNAFALPGGKVYVSRGLLALLNSED